MSNCTASPGASASFRDFGVLAVQANTVTGECQDLLNPSGVSFNMSGLPMGFWQKPICPHTSPSTHTHPHPPAHGCLHKRNFLKDWTCGYGCFAALNIRSVSPRSACVHSEDIQMFLGGIDNYYFPFFPEGKGKKLFFNHINNKSKAIKDQWCGANVPYPPPRKSTNEITMEGHF